MKKVRSLTMKMKPNANSVKRRKKKICHVQIFSDRFCTKERERINSNDNMTLHNGLGKIWDKSVSNPLVIKK